jgi:MEMO1 family protein
VNHYLIAFGNATRYNNHILLGKHNNEVSDMSMRKRVLPMGWYPGTADECKRDIEGFLRGFTRPEGLWIGGVAPHAGWFFSGKAATRVVSTLASSASVDRVVVYGGHLQGGSDPIAYLEGWWETPFGPHPMDAEFAAELVAKGNAVAASRLFNDNTVEILMPLVRHFFPDTPVIAVHSPAWLGAVELGKKVSGLLKEKDLSAIYLGSADLTHYGPNYGFVPRGSGPSAVSWVKEENDKSLIDRALAMDSEGVLRDARNRHNTCSAGPIASVIAGVAEAGVRQGRLLEYYTSHDVMPDSSFVGYAAIIY